MSRINRNDEGLIFKTGKKYQTFGAIKLCRKEKNVAWFFNPFKLIFLSEMYGFEKIICYSYVD